MFAIVLHCPACRIRNARFVLIKGAKELNSSYFEITAHFQTYHSSVYRGCARAAELRRARNGGRYGQRYRIATPKGKVAD